MIEKLLTERTFFSPDIILSGTTEHAMRMPAVALLRDSNNRNVFILVSKDMPDESKLEAVRLLEKSLEIIAHPQAKQESRHGILWQHFLATQLRFYHFAVEDTEPVTQAMSSYILTLFKLAKDMHDPLMTKARQGLVTSLIHKAKKNYDEDHPGSERLPNRRAEALLQNIKAVDPSLIR